MKKLIKTAIYIVLASAALGCAREVPVGPNDENVNYMSAWIKKWNQVNNRDVKPTGLGIYVLEETPGTGAEVKEGGYIFADYITTDLEGNISAYTDIETSKQLGEYNRTYFYGPRVISTIESTIQAGLADAIVGMKVGGRKKVVIPSWLMSYNVYDTAEEYIANSTTGTNTIYDITIHEYTDSIQKFEISRIKEYMDTTKAYRFDSRLLSDTLGFFFQPLSETTEEKYTKDTTIYINYTGKLLNGLVFDTTDERTAKNSGLYSSSKTYEPIQINWSKDDYTKITMGSSSSTVIKGFALTLHHMAPMSKAVGIFDSSYGYSFSGSGSSIPGCEPLIFEIEIVADPDGEDEDSGSNPVD